MNKRTFACLIFCLALSILGCKKDSNVSKDATESEYLNASGNSAGAIQITGIGFYATIPECGTGPAGTSYVVRLTGDVQGCLYAFIDKFNCSPSGTYREEGREYFVGTYNGQSGTFWTSYKFESKFEDCAENGGPLGLEIFGRCQHPLTKGMGTGVFSGATGTLHFKDDVVAGNFPYTGHLKF